MNNRITKIFIYTLSLTVFFGAVMFISDDDYLADHLHLVIEMPDSSKDELDGYIAHAITQKVIPEEDKEYVKAYILSDQEKVKIKMRLKGDWTDHLTYGHPSYRIKINGKYNFHSLKEFSIQHPRTRNFLHEWIIHHLAEEEDLLTTKYGFETVKIGEDVYQYYAYEEHFAKQLLERRNRREGPILKMDESTTWDLLAQGYEQNAMDDLPYFEASQIAAFKEGRTMENASLNQAFSEGQKLLQHFKDGTAPIDEIFDMDQLAKFYVLMELSGSNHGLRWHNRRFYYNPITQKLEHIIYDVVPHSKTEDWNVNFIERRMKSGAVAIPFNFDARIFLNRKFKKRYLFHLNRMTTDFYYDEKVKELWPELSKHHYNLKAIHPDYSFDPNVYKKHVVSLRDGKEALKNFWDAVIEKRDDSHYWQRELTYVERSDSLFAPSIGVVALPSVADSGYGYHVLLENYHVNGAVVIGYGFKEISDTVFLREPIRLNGYRTAADTATIHTNLKPDYFVYQVSNLPKQKQRVNVNNWEKPTGETTRMMLKSGFDKDSDHYTIQENKLVFDHDVTLSNLLLIPAEYQVLVLPGVTIKFEKTGGLIICGSISAIGEPNLPIQFIGVDKTNNGLTVLDANYCKLSHVIFDGLSNLDYGRWELTGALSIYQTPTKMDNVVVLNNHSEDAINLIRCSFRASHIMVSNTYSDGIDLDFCRGKMTGVNIQHTGNDAIDLSGSIVTLTNVKISHSGDKGISGGEGSVISLKNIEVSDAITGVVSKDATVIFGEEITVKQVDFGTGAFCKKAEYGPAIVSLGNYKLENQQNDYLLDKGSVILVNDAQEIGQKILNIDSLYAPFEK